MVTWSHDKLAEHQARGGGNRKRPQFPELQDDRPRPADHRPQEAGLDGEVYPEFRITAEIRISDERDRDNDGAYSTLQDCLITAIGRLAQMDPKTLRKFAAGFKRKRRGAARDRGK